MRAIIVACTFLVAALVSDALTARAPNGMETNAPASMRGVSIALTLALSAPLIQNYRTNYYAPIQRQIIAFALVVAAILGMHMGDLTIRTTDAVYIMITCYGGTLLCASGGVDEKSKEQKIGIRDGTRDTCMLLAASMLLYSAIRTIRAGAVHVWSVRDFTVSTNAFANATHVFETGYAAADETTVTAAMCGGVGAFIASIIIFVHHRDIEPAKFSLATCTLIVGVSAFVATLSNGTQLEHLPLIFTNATCVGRGCDNADKTRRFALSNNPFVALHYQTGALVIILTTFEESLRTINRVILGITAWFFTTVIAYSYCTFQGRGDYIDYTMMIGILAQSFTIIFNDEWTGVVLSLSAQFIQVLGTIRTIGFVSVVTHPFHLSNAICLDLLVIALLFDTINICCKQQYIKNLTSLLSLWGFMLSAFIFFLGLTLVLSYNGKHIHTEFDGKRSSVDFVATTLLPLLTFAQLRSKIVLEMGAVRKFLVSIAATALTICLYFIFCESYNRTKYTWNEFEIQTAIVGGISTLAIPLTATLFI